MRAQMAKLAAVAAVAIAVAVGTVHGGDGAGFAPLDGGAVAEPTRVIEVGSDGDGTPRAGYMVGKHFLGFLPE